MPVKNNIPQCCNGVFFNGDTKIIKIEVPELENLSEFDVVFQTLGYWDLTKTRDSGITTLGNVISIRFESIDTLGHSGMHEYTVKLISPVGEVNTVSYGTLTLK